MYLVTTALREFWPDSGPIYLLSPGCVPNIDDPEIKTQWEIKGCASDPFRGGPETTAAYAEIWRIANDLICLLASRLNQIHDVNHSERYWRTRIGFWALLFVATVYDRHARLRAAKSEIDNVKVIGCIHTNPIIPTDSHDFVYEATDDLYSGQIYTFLCEKMGIPVVEYRAEKIRSQPQKKINLKPSIVKKVLRSVMNHGYAFLSLLFAQRADVLMVSSYLPRWFEIALSFATGGRVFPLHMAASMVELRDSGAVDYTARAALSRVPQDCEGLMALVIEAVGMCIPRSFVEAHQEVCAHSDSVYRNLMPKAIYSANSWWFDESFKHWAAKCQEQGTILIGGEHGGAPFLKKYEIFESFEILVSDHYFTWGWAGAGDSKVSRGPANKLVNIVRRTHKVSGGDIVYICTAEARHNVGMLENFADYFEWQKRFFASTDNSLIGNILVRAHYADFGWDISSRLQKVAPALRFDSWEVSFRKRLRQSRLCVFDYLSTTFSEALAANVPTVLFWDRSKYPICDTLLPHFQELKDVHILHDTPEDAAAWVARIYADPGAWFRSESCQKAVRNFCFQYARKSDAPLKEWKRAFWKWYSPPARPRVFRVSKSSQSIPVHLFKGLVRQAGLLSRAQRLKSSLQRVQMNLIPDVTVHPCQLVFIAGMPKAGTTWLENLIGAVPGYRKLAYYDPGNLLLKHVLDPKLLDHVPARGNFYLKTHVEASGAGALRRHRIPTVVMVRDLRDQCVSQFHHILSDPGHRHHEEYLTVDRSVAFTHCLNISVTEYAEWIRSWLREAGDDSLFLFVRYEDMHADIKGEFSRVLRHYGITLADEEMDSIIERVARWAREGKNLEMRLKQGNTFRAGRIGDWRSHFSPSDVECFKAMANDVLVSLGYERDSKW